MLYDEKKTGSELDGVAAIVKDWNQINSKFYLVLEEKKYERCAVLL